MVGLGVLVLFLLGWALWSRYHTPIATAYSWLRIVEFAAFVGLASVVTPIVAACLASAGAVLLAMGKRHRALGKALLVGGGMLAFAWVASKVFKRWFDFFVGSNKALIEWSHITTSSVHANLFAFLCMILPLAYWIARRSIDTNPTNNKHHARNKPYTLHTFTDEMARIYPHAELFRKLDLTKKSINEGKYRMPDTEKQVAMRERLLDRGKVAGEYVINKDRANAYFRAQMGRLWRGRWSDLSRTEIAVLAILIPRIAATDSKMPDDVYDKALKTTETLIERFWEQSRGYDRQKDTFALDLGQAIGVIKTYAKSRMIKPYLNRHAYVYTLIYGLLQDARTLGVLQGAELRWLRVLDRRLHIMVDNVGRQVAFAEVGGIVSHYLNEHSRNRSSERPLLDAAVAGLIEAVDSFKFSAEEVEQIEAAIKGERQDAIDPNAVDKSQRHLMAFVRTVGVGKDRDLFDVALLEEDGKVVFESRCKPKATAEIIQQSFSLNAADMDALLGAPTSDELRTRILEHCTKQHIVCYGADLAEMVKGVDRAAASITNLQVNQQLDLVMTVIDEGVAAAEEMPSIKSASAGAALLRSLWVERQKAALQAQADALKDGNAPGRR